MGPRADKLPCGLLACVAILLCAAPARADLLRDAPRTGIYVESEYGRDSNGCDWYFPGPDLLKTAPPAGPDECLVVVRIRGTLNQQGAALFAEVSDALLDWPAVPTRIVLNSKGGDSQAALRMARIIREHELYRRQARGVMTTIDEAETAVCFSACVILFAAGFSRYALFDEYDDPALPSRLGIHRPGQYNRQNMRYDSSVGNSSIVRVRRQLERYFDSVGVSPELVDAMFAVPFDDIRLLTEAEARRYGLVP